MVEFKQVLCPVDFSDLSLRGLAYAAAFARWYEATLTVLHVVPSFEPRQVRAGTLGDPVQIVQPVPRNEVVTEVRRILRTVGAEVPHTRALAEEGDAAAVIVDEALRLPADLVVVGTHGRSGFDRLLLGSVTEKVLRKSPCPVLTVPPQVHDAPPAEVTFKQILCPIDFSPSSLQALGFALDLARQGGGVLTLQHAIEWLAEDDVARTDVLALRQQLVDNATARMRALVGDDSRTWCDIAEVVTMGRAHREILRRAADDQSDLIVMGTQGRGGAGLFLFGSTTEQVVRGAGCPVLTVRAPSASSAAGRV